MKSLKTSENRITNNSNIIFQVIPGPTRSRTRNCLDFKKAASFGASPLPAALIIVKMSCIATTVQK